VTHVRKLAESGGGWVDPDTYVGPGSYQAALFAAGATIQGVRDVIKGDQENALVLVRPPGHHARPAKGMGFCLFNSVAAAAQWSIAEGLARKVAIIDIDVHHGNGTQEMFFARGDVLYASYHQYPYYPGTGALDEVGSGVGRGATVNLPLMAGCGDATYLHATEQLLAPAVERFEPECILVSLGFDAHWADPLAGMRVSLSGYREMIERIAAMAQQQCDGRVVFLLEGGYDLQVIEAGTRMAAHILAVLPVPTDPLGPAPGGQDPAQAVELIDAARQIHGFG
jgi:acetoin utilization deacetylase AcuC-like enzyme